MTGWLPAEAEAVFGAGAVAREAYDLLTVDVPAESWLPALRAAASDLGCTFFDWLSAVDEPGTGFRVCAHLVALADGPGAPRRLLVRTTVPHEAAVLPTATGIFPGAAWHERETHEMFGVDFTGHPHLAPLLLPEEFEGHPLRKDFVLAARVVKAWPGAKEPGESHDGGPKRRQMLPPGVPDPNDWGPLKGQLPPAPARPARTPRTGAAGAAAGARAARSAATPSGDRPPRRTRSASEGSASQETPAPPRRRTPDAPWEQPPAAEPGQQPPTAEPPAETSARTEPASRTVPSGQAEPPTEKRVEAEPATESPVEAEPPTEDPARTEPASRTVPSGQAEPPTEKRVEAEPATEGSVEAAPLTEDPARTEPPAGSDTPAAPPATRDPEGGDPA